MGEPLAVQQAPVRHVRTRSIALLQPVLHVLGQISHGSRTKSFAVINLQAAGRDIAEAVRLLQNHFEDRLQIARRTVYHLQYLGDRLLLLQ